MYKPILILLAGSLPLLANDTSLHDGRFGPEPLGETESPVRMVAEHIEVAFGYQYTDVHCTFTFRNTLKDQAVEQLVGFPDIGAAVHEMGRREPERADAIGETVNTSEIRQMRTSVNGKPVQSVLKFGEVNPGTDTDGTAVWSFDRKHGVRAWYTMQVNFPSGEDVTVERRYRVQNGASALGVAFFCYTTATGGVWNGSIGRLQADVTLRDGLTVDQLLWPGAKVHEGKLVGDSLEFATKPARKEWQVRDAKHLRLVWKDFEPRTEKNRRGFSLSRPFHGW
ncbi:hypothetical protein ACXR0O_12385 [Verrucomicrobiota bacterium sgz303538]